MPREKKNIFKKTAMHAPEVLSEAYAYKSPSLFSRGVKLELDNIFLFFISGTASVDSSGRSINIGDFQAQCLRALNNIGSLLESNSATWKDVIKTTIFLKDMKFYKKLNKVRIDFFKKSEIDIFPASSCIEAKLCRKELLVEIEAIAILQKREKR